MCSFIEKKMQRALLYSRRFSHDTQLMFPIRLFVNLMLSNLTVQSLCRLHIGHSMSCARQFRNAKENEYAKVFLCIIFSFKAEAFFFLYFLLYRFTSGFHHKKTKNN